MATVLLIVFVVQLALKLLGTLGAQAVNDGVWLIYTKLPVPQAQQAEANAKLRREVVRIQREMNGVSAQDNFAKWARLRRDHDKAKEKYDKESRGQQQFRSSFDRIVGTLRWLSTQGVNFMLNTWYSKQAMFWLPQGWVPYHVEWILSFPRAPLGSISVNIWSLACGAVIMMMTEVGVALWTLKKGEVQEGSNKGQPVKKDFKAGIPQDGIKKEL